MKKRAELEKIHQELIHKIKTGNDSEELRAKLLVISFALQEMNYGSILTKPKTVKIKYLSYRIPRNIWEKSVWECVKCAKTFSAYGHLREHKKEAHAY